MTIPKIQTAVKSQTLTSVRKHAHTVIALLGYYKQKASLTGGSWSLGGARAASHQFQHQEESHKPKILESVHILNEQGKYNVFIKENARL